MECRNQVTAIIHSHVRFVVESGIDVAIVGLLVFAFDGEGGYAVFSDECGCYVILG
jgi:hypothetical protein